MTVDSLCWNEAPQNFV